MSDVQVANIGTPTRNNISGDCPGPRVIDGAYILGRYTYICIYTYKFIVEDWPYFAVATVRCNWLVLRVALRLNPCAGRARGDPFFPSRPHSDFSSAASLLGGRVRSSSPQPPPLWRSYNFIYFVYRVCFTTRIFLSSQTIWKWVFRFFYTLDKLLKTSQNNRRIMFGARINDA